MVTSNPRLWRRIAAASPPKPLPTTAIFCPRFFIHVIEEVIQAGSAAAERLQALTSLSYLGFEPFGIGDLAILDVVGELKGDAEAQAEVQKRTLFGGGEPRG